MTDKEMEGPARRAGLNLAIWTAQILVGAPFIGVGLMKLREPIDQLSLSVPWAAEYPNFVRFIGAIDLAGGVGLILPAITGIYPRLTTWAAIGCAALMVCAILFHGMRGEWAATPINLVYLALALFIWWGRVRAVPLRPRWPAATRKAGRN